MDHLFAVQLPMRRAVVTSAAALLLAPWARAQRSARVVRVAWLGWTGGEGSTASTLALAAFRAGLADSGWTEGRDLTLLVREGDGPRSAELASELMREGPDVVVTVGPMVFGARAATGTRPVVFCINGDPVEARLVARLSRPGGHLTGVTALSAELAGKRLELLKATLRNGARVAAIANDSHPGVTIERDATQAAAARLGLRLNWYPLKAPADLDAALAAVALDGADGVVAIPDNLINRLARPIAEFTLARRLPCISGWSDFTEAGNLMSYGPNPRAYFRQMAVMTDRLLRGAVAAELAVEQPRELEFVVNLRVARSMKLDLPSELLLRADRQIV